MRVSFTKKQFKLLSEMCLIGAYILEETKIIECEECEELLKYILSYSKDHGLEINEEELEGVELVAATVLRETEEGNSVIKKYNEKIFWDELALMLASRDTIEELGEEINDGNYNLFMDTQKKLYDGYIEKFKLSNYDTMELPY